MEPHKSLRFLRSEVVFLVLNICFVFHSILQSIGSLSECEILVNLGNT
jgi:hypothetical protein